MKKLCMMWLMIIAGLANAAGEGNYVATYTDTTVSGMFSRWAANDGWKLLWKIEYDFPVGDPDNLNLKLTLPRQNSLEGAISTVLGGVGRLGPDVGGIYPIYCEPSQTILVVSYAQTKGKAQPCNGY